MPARCASAGTVTVIALRLFARMPSAEAEKRAVLAVIDARQHHRAGGMPEAGIVGSHIKRRAHIRDLKTDSLAASAVAETIRRGRSQFLWLSRMGEISLYAVFRAP